MDRKEHIERLKAIRNYCCAKKDIESLDYAIASLETDEAYQLEYEKPSGKWIPVNDYLPVTEDEVLVTYIVNGNYKKRYVETANCFNGEWSSINDEYRIPNTKIEILAWMELPKPYKMESEDKK